MKDGKDVLFDDRRGQGRVRAADRHQPPDVQQHLAVEAAGLHVQQLSGEQAQQRADPARKGDRPGKERMYEVRSISHSGGESLPEGRRGDIQILDMSKLMEKFIDMLDRMGREGRGAAADALGLGVCSAT